MADVTRYLKELKSPNKNIRFDACYNLRHMNSIPEIAFLALQEAAKDSDTLVAEEARKALLAHPEPDLNFSMDLDLSTSRSPGELSFLPFVGLIMVVASCMVFNLPSKEALPPSVAGLAFLDNVIPAMVLLFFGLVFLIPLVWRKSNHQPNSDKDKHREDGNALASFVEKAKEMKLTGPVDEFYKAGIVSVEKGQFDNSILEFVKVIRISSPGEELYKLAKKELMGLGFSEEDVDKAHNVD